MDGVLLIDKPAGISSHGVVAQVRRALGTRRVGHAGTLDPFATGLLLVLVGRATRAQRFLMEQPKAYSAEAHLGWTSTTGDPEGELIETGVIAVDPPLLPTGEMAQRPPVYSAIHIDGERAYKRARRGEEVEIPERDVTLTRFVQTRREGDRAWVEIECSSGTYVRSLVADHLADAYCAALRRTAIGPFCVADAIAPAQATEEGMVELGAALSLVLPARDLEPADVRAIVFGQRIDGTASGLLLLRDPDGAVAIAREGEPGRLRPVVGFRAE